MRTLGPYRLLRKIGEGGMAEVYLAEGEGADGVSRQLAVKVLHKRLCADEKLVRMLLDEARVAVRLDHPNIVRAFELGRVEPYYFFSMEYVDGVDLHHLLRQLSRRNENLPPSAALYIAQQLLRGLDYVHGVCDESGAPLKLVHRDISPSNVLVSRQGEVKIADFGIARATALPSKTVAGEIKGKLGYMSPEQVTGGALDKRSDIFSVGVVVFEALTNKPLYGDISQAALIRAMRSPLVPPPSRWRHDLPQVIDSLLVPATAKNPNDRYQAAVAFERAVTSTLEEITSGYTPEQFAQLIQGILAGEEAAPRAPAALRIMRREDFVATRHSVIAQQALSPHAPLPGPVATERWQPAASRPARAEEVDAQRPTLIDLEPEPGASAAVARSPGPLRPSTPQPPTHSKTLQRVDALGMAPTAAADFGEFKSPAAKEEESALSPTLPPSAGEGEGGAQQAPSAEPALGGAELAGAVTSAKTNAAAGSTEAATAAPPAGVHGAPTVLLGRQGADAPTDSAPEPVQQQAEPSGVAPAPAAQLRPVHPAEQTAEAPVLTTRRAGSGRGGLAVVGVIALIVGAGIGAAVVVLAGRSTATPAAPVAERVIALAAGEAAKVDPWTVQVERISRVGTTASEQLVVRVRLSRGGSPATDGGRFFFLQWAGGYESPTVLPGSSPESSSLSFRLPKGVTAKTFDVRFAPPDAASALLRMELPR